MPIPIPLLLLAGALLFGGKKKKKPSGPKIEPIHAELAKPPIKPIHVTKVELKEAGKPWARCKPPAGSPEGSYAAFGQGGRCMVFWTPETSQIVKGRLMEEYDKAPNKNEICARDQYVEDPYGHGESKYLGGTWTTNKHREALVIKVIRELWPQIPKKELPPVEGRSSYFVEMVWELTMGWFASQVCNLNRVT